MRNVFIVRFIFIIEMVMFSFLQSFMSNLPHDLVIVTEIGFLIIIATILGFLVRLSKQPLIPAYILTGIIIGPLVLGMVEDPDLISNLSQIGVAFLIFTAGIEIKLGKLKEVGKVASVGGTIQVLAMFFLAFLVAMGFGFAGKAPAYIGLVVAFSSTMVVITLLAQKKELNSLHGRIVIGFLLIQDIAAVIALAILGSDLSFNSMVFVLLKAIGFGVFALIVSKLSNPFFRRSADNHEMLLLMSISFLFIFIIGAAAAELSLVIGAFFAGVALANSDYKTEIQGNITSLREFFAVIFFVALGMQLQLISGKLVALFFVLLLLVIIIKPLLIMFMVRIAGYKKRTSFFTGNALAQTSEFSLIIVTIGLAAGHITQGLFSTLVLLTVLTMSLTTYFITYEKRLEEMLSWPLNFLGRFRTNKEELDNIDRNDKEVVIFGCHRIGSLILRDMEKQKDNLMVVDYNPQIIKSLIDKKIPCIYGDFMHEEILEKINLKNSKIFISTIPEFEDNIELIKKIKRVNKSAIVIIVAGNIKEASKLYSLGADYVILPQFISGEKISDLIGKAKKGGVGKMKSEHKKYLKGIGRWFS